jgi:hypothetical protein
MAQRRAGIYLDNDLEIKNVVVAADYRSIGVANNLARNPPPPTPPLPSSWPAVFSPNHCPAAIVPSSPSPHTPHPTPSPSS